MRSNQVYQYQYNEVGTPTQTMDPFGRTVYYAYDPNNFIDLLKVQVQGANGPETVASYTYDSRHNPLTFTDASGQTTNYSYNGYGELLAVIDPKNEKTTFNYNGAYLTSVVGPIPGSTVAFTYDFAGRVASVTDSEGYAVAISYDAADRPFVGAPCPDSAFHSDNIFQSGYPIGHGIAWGGGS